MGGTETDVRRTGWLRRRRLALGALLVVAATLATTMVVANPASAAAVCGSQVRVRNSIYYKACNAPGPQADLLRTALLFRNDHGSAVSITFQEAFKIDGQLRGFDWDTMTIPAGHSRPPDQLWTCVSGIYYSYAFRVKENNGSAGPWSVAPAVRCP
jgi:hypothetical protein